MNSFITWGGGKRSIRHDILSQFPRGYDRYIEVFGGGGSILFAKPVTNFEDYNDFNNNLTNMFNVVKKKVMSFLKELDYFPMNLRWDFDALKDGMKKLNMYGDVIVDCKMEKSFVKSLLQLRKKL